MKTLSFSYGAPSVDIVDVDGLAEAAGRAFRRDPAGAVGYGDPAGYGPLREWIADRHGVRPEQVLVSNGSLQTIGLLLDVTGMAGQPVVVEKPTYDLTLQTIQRAGAQVRPIEVDADGLDTDRLGELLATGTRPTMIYLVPNFQNPTGVTLSLERRKTLAQLARDHEFTLFEDDPYQRLRFRGDEHPSLFELAGGVDRVVYGSSFSKIICPGVRVGYLIAPADVVRRMTRRALGEYITPGMFAQSVVYEYCTSDRLDGAVGRSRIALAERADRLASALREWLPEASFSMPDGGYFLWVRLPGLDSEAVLAAARDEAVQLVSGRSFLGGPDLVRLCFAGLVPDELDEGVQRLARAVAAVQAGSR